MTPAKKTPLIRLHGLLPYDRSAKARWLLKELGVEYEDRWWDREKKEHEGPEFLRLNPMGRVPVLEFGDQVIFESGAICTFLADQYPDVGLAPLSSSPHRGEYLKWMFFASGTLDVFQTRIMVIEDIPAGEIQKEKEAALQSDLNDALEALDQTLSKSVFLVANRFSAADICVSYHLYFLRLWPELDSVLHGFPRVTAYLEEMKKRPFAVEAAAFSYQ